MPYQIRVERSFAATHQLRLPDGSLEPNHGHGWAVAVVVESGVLDAMDCVMDFHVLQKQIDAVTLPWHRRHLNDVPPFKDGVNPSAERVAEMIARGLSIAAPARLVRVEVAEATGCVATYFPETATNGR